MDSQTPMFRTAAAQTLADEATRTFMNRVYAWMFVGLAATGAIAMVASTNLTVLQTVIGLRLPIFIGMLVFTWVVSASIHRLAPPIAGALFLGYASLLGLWISPIFLVYTKGSISQTFFISAGTYAAMSVYGTVTKKDLSSWGTFLFMGVIGIVIAAVINMIWPMPMLSFVAACAGVVVFAGLTAYDTQKLRNFGAQAEASGMKSFAISGALQLYLDFINLFLSLLRLLGNRR